MDKQIGVIAIAGACLLVLFMAAVKRKAELCLNFCLRAVLGMVAICALNRALEELGIPCAVGINLCSLLTSGILGFGGVSLLYAIAACALL